MKTLLEILVEQLDEWPKTTDFFAYALGSITPWIGSHNDSEWSNEFDMLTFPHADVDFNDDAPLIEVDSTHLDDITAIITKQQWLDAKK